MAQRIFSTFLLWAVVLGLIWWQGRIAAVVLVTLITVGTLREFYKLISAMGPDPFDKLGMTLGAVIAIAPLFSHRFPAGFGPADLVALPVILFAIRILGEREPHNRIETLAWTLFGTIYVAFMLQFLSRIALLYPEGTGIGVTLCAWTVAVTKCCDVGALLTGMAFGRHQMSPRISPKKTWEGAVGGVLISAAVGATIAWLARAYVPDTFTPLFAGLLALPLAALGIVADLVESVMKRRAALKDSGGVIPGIGGLFDLSDSLILTSPVAYVAFRFLL